MFKKIQRAVATLVNSDTLPRHVDVEFDRAKANFSIMDKVLSDVKRQIEEYRVSMRGLCTASSAAMEALALLFPQPSNTMMISPQSGLPGGGGGAVLPTTSLQQHPYSPLAHSSKSRLNSLLSERFEQCERRLTHTCLANCSEVLDKFAALKLRLQEREEALEELEHYAHKTAGLRKDREKLIAAGKKETLKEEERRLRNEECTNKLRTAFVAMNSALTEELSAYWEKRLDLLTPLILDFLTAQQKFASELTDCSFDITRAKEQVLKSAPVIDFSAVLYQVTTAAETHVPRGPRRRYSHSQSSSTSGYSGGGSALGGSVSGRDSPPLVDTHATAPAATAATTPPTSSIQPPPVTTNSKPPTVAVLPPPLPVGMTITTTAGTIGAPNVPLSPPSNAASHPPPPPPPPQQQAHTQTSNSSSGGPPPLPANLLANLQQHNKEQNGHAAAAASLHSGPPPLPGSMNTLSTPPSTTSSSTPLPHPSPSPAPAIPARPPKPGRATLPHGATLGVPLVPSASPNPSPSPLPPPLPGSSPQPSISPLPATPPSTTHHHGPPPLPSSSMVSASAAPSTTSATAAAAALDASYDLALRSKDAPQFIPTTRSTGGPPPLPPTNNDPEPWTKDQARSFEKMHAAAEEEMRMAGVPEAPMRAYRKGTLESEA